MPNGVPPFATYVPGADSHLNASRAQGVPFAVSHRTQGTDSRGLGKNRRHSTPGTFNFLIRDEATYCYYPAHVRCSHAAGGNDGPGIEIEGFTGQPISQAQSARLGQLAHWLHDTYGVPLTLYDGPRKQIDDTAFRGFVNHGSIQTQPQWRHTDRISPAEWDQAVSVAITLKEFEAMFKHEDENTAKVLDAITGLTLTLSATNSRLDELEAKIDAQAARFTKAFPNRANR